MKLRRPMTVLAALAFAFSALIAAPVAASTKPVTTNDRPSSNAISVCADATTEHYFAGRGSSTNRTAIVATIDPGPGFGLCADTTGIDIVSGTSSWVAFEGGNDDTQIIQIGFYKCAYFFGQLNEGCDNYFHWGWAVGGCGYNPYWHNLGTMDAIAHPAGTFRIDYVQGVFKLYADFGGGYILYKSIPASDPGIACWVGSANRRVTFRSERHDRGDGISHSTQKNTWRSMKTKSGGVWTDFGDASTGCDASVIDGHCDFIGVGAMDTWDD